MGIFSFLGDVGEGAAEAAGLAGAKAATSAAADAAATTAAKSAAAAAADAGALAGAKAAGATAVDAGAVVAAKTLQPTVVGGAAAAADVATTTAVASAASKLVSVEGKVVSQSWYSSALGRAATWIKANPKLAIAGVTAAGIAGYAASNGLTIDQAVSKAASGTGELVGSAAGSAAAGAFQGLTNPGGSDTTTPTGGTGCSGLFCFFETLGNYVKYGVIASIVVVVLWLAWRLSRMRGRQPTQIPTMPMPMYAPPVPPYGFGNPYSQ